MKGICCTYLIILLSNSFCIVFLFKFRHSVQILMYGFGFDSHKDENYGEFYINCNY